MTKTMSDRKRDESSGRYVDKYPPETILEVIRDLGGTPATSEVADAVDAPRDTIYKKLQKMETDGLIASRKAGGIRVWSPAGDGDE